MNDDFESLTKRAALEYQRRILWKLQSAIIVISPTVNTLLKCIIYPKTAGSCSGM